MNLRTALAAVGLVALGAVGVTAYGPTAVAFAKEQAISVAMTHEHLSPSDQQALLGDLKAKYPELAPRLEAWLPITPAKIQAVNHAYWQLPSHERHAIAHDVNAWQSALLSEHSSLRHALQQSNADRRIADQVLNLPASDRAAISSQTLAFWNRLETKYPHWVAKVDSLLSQKS